VETSKLERISEKWLKSYALGFAHFAKVVRLLDLCKGLSYMSLLDEVHNRVQSLKGQHVSKGVGYSGTD